MRKGAWAWESAATEVQGRWAAQGRWATLVLEVEDPLGKDEDAVQETKALEHHARESEAESRMRKRSQRQSPQDTEVVERQAVQRTDSM